MDVRKVVGLVLLVWAGLSHGCREPEQQRGGGTATGATRVVSVAPALTAMIASLGAAEMLVGVTAHCDKPAGRQDLPVIGDFRPVPELVLAAEPSLVLMADYASQAPERAKLEALGLPVAVFPLETLADLRSSLGAIGARLGRKEAAGALVLGLDAALEELSRCLEAGAAAPRFALIYGTEPGFVYTTGGGDHIAELFEVGGGVNALAGHPRSARLGIERILEAAPDLIVHVAPGGDAQDDAAALKRWARWRELPAVRRRAVRVWPDDRLARNGPHLAELVGGLCTLLKAGGAP